LKKTLEMLANSENENVKSAASAFLGVFKVVSVVCLSSVAGRVPTSNVTTGIISRSGPCPVTFLEIGLKPGFLVTFQLRFF